MSYLGPILMVAGALLMLAGRERSAWLFAFFMTAGTILALANLAAGRNAVGALFLVAVLIDLAALRRALIARKEIAQ